MMTIRLVALLALSGCCLAFPTRALAAQGYDSCTGFIDSVPATITTQGTWCLRKDLSTSITTGNALTVATNNVTIDCNDFKLGGLAAGDASNAGGLFAEQRQNIAVRNCNIRGFRYGVRLQMGAGHVVERNRFDNNLSAGIYLFHTDNSVVRDNHVFDTGGHLDQGSTYGIYSHGGDAVRVTDNFVSGVVGLAGYDPIIRTVGIYRANSEAGAGGGHPTSWITGNTVSGLGAGPGGRVNGFYAVDHGNTEGRIVFAENHLALSSTVAGSYGVNCFPGIQVSMRDNMTWGFETGWPNHCVLDDGGNIER